MAPPGSGSNIKPTISPAKMAKNYQACCGKPSGTGASATTKATTRGAKCFQVIFIFCPPFSVIEDDPPTSRLPSLPSHRCHLPSEKRNLHREREFFSFTHRSTGESTWSRRSPWSDQH